jgi:hypothetical protein
MPARSTSFRAPRRVHVARATRGDGRVAPPIRKDPIAASYGCPAGARRDNAMKGGKERCKTRSAFETSKYNNCNICLKAVETLQTCF